MASSRFISENEKYRKYVSGERHETEAARTNDKVRKEHRCRLEKSIVSSNGSLSLRLLFSWWERNLRLSQSEHKATKAKPSKPKLPVLWTFKTFYAHEVEYTTYRLENCSLRYEKLVSSYIAKLVKKVKLKMKARFFDPRIPKSIIGFLVTFKISSDTNSIHERVVYGAYHLC